MRISKTIGRLSPFISLASGFVTVALFRRGVDFAPISAGLAVAAWLSAILFSRFLSPPVQVAEEDVSKNSNVVRFASRTLVTGIYQNVLFFLVPIWFGSATLCSANIAFPMILCAIALFSCFDGPFAEHVLSRRLRRSIVSGVILFAVSVPALCVLTFLSVRISVALSAGGAALASVVLGTSADHRGKRFLFGVTISAIALVAFYFAAPFLPPTPVQCLESAAATGVADKDPVKVDTQFIRGTSKVFAHFAVAAPDRYAQEIHFQWYANGEKRGKPIASKIVGGRKHGFRTWTYISKPSSGRYRVDLLTADRQLIGRVIFNVK